jgi:hypothetical protein
VIWRTGAACELCAEIVQDKTAARERARRAAQGLCLEHGTCPCPSGRWTNHDAGCGAVNGHTVLFDSLLAGTDGEHFTLALQIADD